MIYFKRGIVTKIIDKTNERSKVMVLTGKQEAPAVNYNNLTGEIKEQDEVILNTTAVELNLGTGGVHFIVFNLSSDYKPEDAPGHIMKLRYTPYQLKVMAAEEQESPYHQLFNRFDSLNGMPVLVGTLHSMLSPMAAVLKYLKPGIKIAYIMTDAAALPVYFSDTVFMLKEKKIIESVITAGHAFGGDIESTTIYNGLIAAKEIAECDIAIIAMGPGIVGTGTTFGFTGIEQGFIADAVNDLKGIPIVVPRISFSDPRERHKGLSHHTITVLGTIMKSRCSLAIHDMEPVKKTFVTEQIHTNKLHLKHNIIEIKENIVEKAAAHFEIAFQTMGRKYDEDKDYFKACGAAAVYAHSILRQ